METVEFKTSVDLVPYEEAVSFMEERVAQIREQGADDCVWFLEHPPLYTAGTSAKPEDLLGQDFPVFKTGRGGEHTYHGPGQRVCYLMLDLKKQQQTPDLKKYICNLESWVIATLAEFDIEGERREGRVGIWVRHDNTESKIAAIGVRIRRWVAYHGVSINLNPDLSHFNGIVPCGISQYGVTSFEKLGKDVSMDELDVALKRNYERIFVNQQPNQQACSA